MGIETVFHHHGENDLYALSGNFDGTIPCFNDANFGELCDGPSYRTHRAFVACRNAAFAIWTPTTTRQDPCTGFPGGGDEPESGEWCWGGGRVLIRKTCQLFQESL
jgi:hypothetical protein